MLVIGIGSPDGGDDTVGWTVAAALEGICDTALSTGEPAELIERWRHRDRVVLVDAVRGEGSPGEITVVDLLSARPASRPASSSHGLGPIEAVGRARAIDRLPGSLTLVGIEARTFAPGTGLSPAVERGAARAVEVISGWVAGGDPE